MWGRKNHTYILHITYIIYIYDLEGGGGGGKEGGAAEGFALPPHSSPLPPSKGGWVGGGLIGSSHSHTFNLFVFPSAQPPPPSPTLNNLLEIDGVGVGGGGLDGGIKIPLSLLYI